MVCKKKHGVPFQMRGNVCNFTHLSVCFFHTSSKSIQYFHLFFIWESLSIIRIFVVFDEGELALYNGVSESRFVHMGLWQTTF